jgi:hypothetical protein
MNNATHRWTTFDAATQLYRDGIIDAHEYDGTVLDAFGEHDGLIVLCAVLAVLGE